MKIFLFSLLLTVSTLFGQPQNNFPPFAPIIPFETEVISFPRTDGDFSVYFIYKIPYRLLVFERQGESFIASFRIIVEISDMDGKLVDRDIKDSKISVDSFEKTNEQNLFLQDYLNFKIKPDEYKVAAIISDMNSSGERPLKPYEINLQEMQKKVVLNPIVLEIQEIICNEKRSIIMSNSGGNIPFSENQYTLIIPVTDTTVSEIDVTLENNDDVVFSGKINDSFDKAIGITKCDDKIIVTESSDNEMTRFFFIQHINEKLNEGNLVLKIKNEEKNIDEKIELRVVWFNKPMSLMNPEKAIELLINIDSETVVDDLLRADDSDYPKVLQNYWAKFDPSPETSFNEIMFEFYSRVDYAIVEFGSITNNNGAKSDRGKVYIKFGKPDKIERNSDSQGEVLEVWTYSNSQRTFTFIDKLGTGNFTLTEN